MARGRIGFNPTSRTRGLLPNTVPFVPPVHVNASFVDAGANAVEGTNVLPHTFTLPATVTAGDILIVSAGIASSTTLVADGAGMTAQAADNINTRSGHAGHTWVRTLTGAYSGTTITLTSGAVLKAAITWEIVRIPNVIGSPVFTATNGAASLTFDAPAFTPDPLKVAVHAIAGSTAAAAPPTAWTPPSGVTARATRGTGGTTGRSSSAVATALTANAVLGTTWTTDVTTTWSATTVVFTTTA